MRGPTFSQICPNLVPIIPITNISDQHGSSCERQQIPLKLAWSITIHKSQGLTIDKAYIDLGQSEKVCGLTYVALSRVRSLQDLYLEPIPFERLSKIKDAKKALMLD